MGPGNIASWTRPPVLGVHWLNQQHSALEYGMVLSAKLHKTENEGPSGPQFQHVQYACLDHQANAHMASYLM